MTIKTKVWTKNVFLNFQLWESFWTEKCIEYRSKNYEHTTDVFLDACKKNSPYFIEKMFHGVLLSYQDLCFLDRKPV